MTTPNFLPDYDKRLRNIEDTLARVARAARETPYQVLPNGLPFFPGGMQVGSGAVQIGEPPVLPVPTGLTATPGASFDTIWVDVSWTAGVGLGSDQIVAFVVLAYKQGDPVPIETTVNDGTTTRVQPLEPATQYRIVVASISRTGRNSTSVETTVTTGKDTGAPAAPTGVTVTPGMEMLIVSWAPNTERDVANGAGQYRLVVSTSSSLAAPVFDQRLSATVATVPSLAAGTPYYVGLYAIDSSGNQSPRTTPSGGPWVPLAVPTTTTALSVGGGNIVRNSGFEDAVALSGWSPTTGCSRSNVQFHGAFGVNSLLINGTGDYFAFQDLSLSAGKWIISCWSMASSIASAPGDTTNKGAGLRALVQSGTLTNFAVVSGATADGGDTALIGKGSWAWKRVVMRFEITSAVATIRVQLQRGISGACTGLAYFDEVQAENGDTITAYAPRADEIGSGTITSTLIADDAITTPKLAAGSVVAGKVAANTIGTNELIAASVVAGKLAANSVVAGNIAASAVTTSTIAAGAITANSIAANAVTTAKIAAGSITTDRLAVTNTLAVGQSILSTNYAPGATGWRIDGAGNAEFANATIRGSAFVGGSINMSGKLFVDNSSSDMHVYSNLEFGSNYSGTLYSGLPVSGSGFFGFQVGNDGLGGTGSQVWTHVAAPVGGNPAWAVGLFDSYPATQKRMLYGNQAHNIVKPGPDGVLISEKRDQAGDFATKGLIVQNGPVGAAGNADHVGISLHAPNWGRASVLQLDAWFDDALQARNSANTAFVRFRAAGFDVSSARATKKDIEPLEDVSQQIAALQPVSFTRVSTALCSFCNDTGKTTEGEKCPLCKGKKGQGYKRRTEGQKRTDDTPFFGLIAEEVAEVVPEAVAWQGSTAKDVKPVGIDYSVIVAMLIKHNQSLDARLADLEDQLA